MSIQELKQKIIKQEQENIRLFKTIPIATKEDPMNKKAEPILKLWREGCSKLRDLNNELFQLEEIERKERLSKQETTPETKTFINGYGEATNKYITSSTYERALKRNEKLIVSFMGNR